MVVGHGVGGQQVAEEHTHYAKAARVAAHLKEGRGGGVGGGWRERYTVTFSSRAFAVDTERDNTNTKTPY